jgi:hypothetical protein
MVPWFHGRGGSPEEDRWRKEGREFYPWLAAHEPDVRNRGSVADLGAFGAYGCRGLASATIHIQPSTRTTIQIANEKALDIQWHSVPDFDLK